jgi:predicted transcriptional regulator
MTKEALAELLERVSTWSEEAQEELAHSIVEIESRHADTYELTDEDRAAINRGLADIRAGRIVSDEKVTALFHRYFP